MLCGPLDNVFGQKAANDTGKNGWYRKNGIQGDTKGELIHIAAPPFDELKEQLTGEHVKAPPPGALRLPDAEEQRQRYRGTKRNEKQIDPATGLALGDKRRNVIGCGARRES